VFGGAFSSVPALEQPQVKAGVARAALYDDDETRADAWLQGRTLEVTGAIGVLIPRFSRKAALVLATVMAGAIFAHLTVLSSPPTLPAVLLVLTLILTWIRH